VTCNVPIYVSMELQAIWRSLSYGLNYWELIGSRRAQLDLEFQHLEEHPLVFQSETSRGGSTHLDLSFYRIWNHLEASITQAKILGLLSSSGGRAINQGVWTWPWYFLYWSLFCIQPLEAYIFLSRAFCSNSYLLSWSYLMLFQINILIVSGSFLLYQ